MFRFAPLPLRTPVKSPIKSLAALLLPVALLAAVPAGAHGEHAAAHASDANPHDTSSQIAIPDNLTAIWQAIDAQTAALQHSLDNGTLADVHHQAYAIRDLVAALPAHSGDLDAQHRGALDNGIKFVNILAQRLDAAGDSKDAAAVRSNYDKLQNVLTSLRPPR